MNEETKERVLIILQMLKVTLNENSVSMATDKDGNIYFFDTNIYLASKKMNGIKVNIKDLARQ